jgi:cytoskeletal protein CcmA (bactofilin family)
MFFTDDNERMRIYKNGDVSMNENLTVHGDTSMNGSVTIGGDASFNGELYLKKAAILDSTLSVSKAATMASTLNVTGASTLSSTLEVSNAATMKSTLNVSKAATMESTLYVSNATTLKSTLNIGGKTTLVGDLSMNGNMKLDGYVDISGDLSLNGNLTVVKYDNQTIINTNINDYSLIVTEDLSLNGELHISGDASMNNNLKVGNSITASPDENTKHYFGKAVIGFNGRGDYASFAHYDHNTIYNYALNQDHSGRTLINCATGTGIHFRVNNENYMSLNQDGNVGIGTTSPESTLDVSGDVIIGSVNKNSQTQFQANLNILEHSSGSQSSAVKIDIGSGNTNVANYNDCYRYQLRTEQNKFLSDSRNASFHISEVKSPSNTYNGYGTVEDVLSIYRGKIGIGTGTKAPSTKLEIHNTSEEIRDRFYDIHNTGNIGDAGLFVLSDLSYNASHTGQPAPNAFFCSNNNYSSDGDPNTYDESTTTYDIAGSIGFGTVAPYFGRYAQYAQIRGLRLGKWDGGLSFATMGTTPGYLSEKMRITNNGSVGIGTTSPQSTLDVSGNIKLNNSIYGTNDDLRLWSNATDATSSGYIEMVPTETKIAGKKIVFATNSSTTSWGDTRVTISESGSVGINKSDPSISYKLDVNGDVNATSYNASSDYRIKENVVPISDTSYNIDNLRPVTYTNTKMEKQDFGVIAHELQEQIPFLVTGEKDGEHHQSVNYNGLIGLLLNEVQQLKKRVQELEQSKP